MLTCGGKRHGGGAFPCRHTAMTHRKHSRRGTTLAKKKHRHAAVLGSTRTHINCILILCRSYSLRHTCRIGLWRPSLPVLWEEHTGTLCEQLALTTSRKSLRRRTIGNAGARKQSNRSESSVLLCEASVWQHMLVAGLP